MNQVIGVIPARYESSRFPGKPLANILGKSLIQRSYENALRCSTLSELLVATDDIRIAEHVKEFGGKVVMTSPDCATGTDRIAEVVKNLKELDDNSIIINIQGDEPCLDPKIINEVIALLQNDNNAVMGTAVTPLSPNEDPTSPSIVKCVLDLQGNALYFSRSPIPSKKDAKLLRHKSVLTYLRHTTANTFTKS
jgi:3-deoxy-manno-octulosonate cytidylyltransferase (CMP-KDO synthetase)